MGSYIITIELNKCMFLVLPDVKPLCLKGSIFSRLGTPPTSSTYNYL